jgi:serine/threonine-protein kinase
MFGPYRLDRLIARGGMGEVYRAHDTNHDRMVALKRIRPELATDAEAERRFEAECTMVAQLVEPHVIPIHHFGRLEGRLFLDMRLVEGADLAKLLATHGALAPPRAVAVIGQVAAALDAAHAAGLVHRDVKPANVLVTAEGEEATDFIYVVDFGIAKALSSDSSSATSTGVILGSLPYVAPERLVGAPFDRRVDVYALGCLLFEALTGRRAFLGTDWMTLLTAHLTSTPPRPSALVAGLPTAFDQVVARALAKDPKDRYPSAGALAADARAVLDGRARRGATARPFGLVGSVAALVAALLGAVTLIAGASGPAARAGEGAGNYTAAPQVLPFAAGPAGPAGREGQAGQSGPAGPAGAPAVGVPITPLTVEPTAALPTPDAPSPTEAPLYPATPPPGTSQPGTTQPGTTQPGTTQPGTTQPGTTQPGTPSTTRAVPQNVPPITVVSPSSTPSTTAAPLRQPQSLEITGVSTYREGVLVFLSVSYRDVDADARGFGFRGVNGSGWAEETHLFEAPSFGRVRPGGVDYPFNHGCGQPAAAESDVEFWVYDSGGRRDTIVAHLDCA